jgi:hypothetical protein
MDALNINRLALGNDAPAVAWAALGALATASLLLLAPATARAADDFPRLGLYGHVDGRGMPLVDANGLIDAVVLDRIARRHLVILDATPFTEYRPDVLQALRARRPGIKLLGYVQAEYIFRSYQADSTVNLPTRIRILVRNLNGYLYDREGEEFNGANINLAKKNAQGRLVVAEALADFFVDHILVAGQWDGLFFDRYCKDIWWTQGPNDSIDYQRAGYPSLAAFNVAWTAATDTLANRMRRRAGNTPILIGNCGQMDAGKFASFNGWMRENFPYQNGGTWHTNVFRDPGGYLFDQARARAPYAGWMTAWPTDNLTPYSSENARRARLSLATAALGEGYGGINPPDLDPFTGYMNWWYDEYAVNRVTGVATENQADTGWLGRAVGPQSLMMWIDPTTPDGGGPNPGFESSLTGWTFTTTNGSIFVRDATTAGVGSASARVSMPGAAPAYAAILTSNTSISFMPDTYSVTVWARATSARPVWVVIVNAATGVPYLTMQMDVDTTWRRYRVTCTGVLGNAKVQFRLGGTSGSVWLDDVHFQRGNTSVYRRDFDFGTVLVNPEPRDYTVVMEGSFRRILGLRDPVVNNGVETSQVLVRANNAVFLLKPLSQMVGVDPPAAGGAPALAWSSAAPNPSRAGVETIRLALTLAEAGAADVSLHDVRGRRVRRLHAGPLAAGAHAFAWDGRDESGRAVAPGIYFARAATGTVQATRKLVLR